MCVVIVSEDTQTAVIIDVNIHVMYVLMWTVTRIRGGPYIVVTVKGTANLLTVMTSINFRFQGVFQAC